MPQKHLSEKQAIFKELFRDQLRQELQFVDDVANGRAQERVGMKGQVYELIKTCVAPADELNISGIIATSLEMIFSELKDRLEGDSKILAAIMWLRAKKSVDLDNSIDEIAERLALQLATVVNRVTKDSLPTLVHGLVMRVLDHWTEKNLKDANVSLSELFLDGIVHGNSGAFNETFRNVPLELEDQYARASSGSAAKERLKKESHLYTFTVEGIGRSGFAVASANGTERFYAHEKVERRNVIGHAKETMSAVKDRFTEHGAVRAMKGIDKAFHESSHNYTKLDDQGRVKYGFIQLVASDDGHVKDLYAFETQHGLKAEDVDAHKQLVDKGRLVRVDANTFRAYLLANKTTPQSLNQFVKGVAFIPKTLDMKQNDLTNANFSGAMLSRLDFSGMKLTNVNFSDCLLVEANFDNAKAKNCNFSNSHLGSAKFNNSVFSQCDFTMANCSGSQCENTQFENIQFLGSRWDAAKMNQVQMSDKLRKEFESHQGKMQRWRESQQKKVKLLQQDISSIEGKIVSLQTANDNAEASTREVNQQVTALKSKLSSAMEAYQDESSQLASLIESHGMEYEAFSNALDSRITLVESDVRKVQKDMSKVKQEVDDLRGKLVDHSYYFETIRGMHEQMTSSRSSRTPSPERQVIHDWQMPHLNQKSLPRKKVLQEVERLQNKNNGPTTVTQLTGRSQSGKSECAAALCHEAKKANAQRTILWVSSEDGTSMRDAYYKLALSVVQPARNESIDSVINKFNNMMAENKNWILVFDNVENPADLKGLIPARGGSVIVTTQKPVDQYEKVTVPDLTAEEAKQFLKIHLKFTNIPATELEKLYAQYGGWVGPLKDVCNQLNKHNSLEVGMKALDAAFTVKSSNKTTQNSGNSVATILSQFDDLVSSLEPETKKLLQRMKFYNAMQLPINLLADNFDITFHEITTKHLPELQKLYLVENEKSDSGNDVISINPLYLSAIKSSSQLQSQDEIKDYLAAVNRALSFYTDALDPDKPEFMNNQDMWTVFDGLMTHYKQLEPKLGDFFKNNPNAQQERYSLLLMFGFQARHAYQDNNMIGALNFAEKAIQLIKQFSDNEYKLLFASSNNSWVSIRYNALQRILKDIVRKADNENAWIKPQAEQLLEATIEINERIARLAAAQRREQETQIKVQHAQRKVDEVKKQLEQGSDTPKSTVSLSEKRTALEAYKQQLDAADSVTQLDEIYKAIRETDKVMGKSARFLGISLGGMQHLPGSMDSQLTNYYQERRGELEKAEKNSTPTGPTGKK